MTTENQVSKIEKEFSDLLTFPCCTDPKVYLELEQKAQGMIKNLGCGERRTDGIGVRDGTGYLCKTRLCSNCKKLKERLEKIK